MMTVTRVYRVEFDGRTLGTFTVQELKEVRRTIDRILHGDESGNLERVLEAVCQVFAVPRSALFARDRRESTVWPRQVAMAALYDLGGTSFMAVGKVWGKDHGTVIYARESVQERCEQCEEDREKVEAVRGLVRSAECGVGNGEGGSEVLQKAAKDAKVGKVAEWGGVRNGEGGAR